jgi:two-component system, sensor histidine kinase and response regulator
VSAGDAASAGGGPGRAERAGGGAQPVLLEVLVADDEPGLRSGIARVLRSFSVDVSRLDTTARFTVVEAGSGEEALERIAAHPPDVLLLDFKMPGISGLDLLEMLPAGRHDFLTIMITAYATIETAVLATKRGAYDFLAKPFTPDELRDVLRKATVHLVAEREAQRLALEKRRVRFEFVRTLGHELKAPLAAIEGLLGLVRAHARGDAVGDYDELVDRCVARIGGMRKLILDLLDLTRIESGQKARDLQPVDVRAVAEAAIEGQAVAARSRGIAIELEAEGPCTFTADRGELAIVLDNLLSNAVKYNRDAGSVRVRITGTGDVVAIAVRDTGIGLCPDDASRLGQEFLRIRSHETAHIEGSGLGLSIVKRIAQLYGGDLGVESRAGEGSTFTVTLRREPE